MKKPVTTPAFFYGTFPVRSETEEMLYYFIRIFLNEKQDKNSVWQPDFQV